MFYAQINQSFIDMENMFELFKEVQTVKDEPFCPNLQVITVSLAVRDLIDDSTTKYVKLGRWSFRAFLLTCLATLHVYGIVRMECR